MAEDKIKIGVAKPPATGEVKPKSTSSIMDKYKETAKGKVVQWTITDEKGNKSQVLVRSTGNVENDMQTARQKGGQGRVTSIKTVTKPADKPVVTKVPVPDPKYRAKEEKLPPAPKPPAQDYKAQKDYAETTRRKLNTSRVGEAMAAKSAEEAKAKFEETGVRVKPKGTQPNHHVTTGNNHTKTVSDDKPKNPPRSGFGGMGGGGITGEDLLPQIK